MKCDGEMHLIDERHMRMCQSLQSLLHGCLWFIFSSRI